MLAELRKWCQVAAPDMRSLAGAGGRTASLHTEQADQARLLWARVGGTDGEQTISAPNEQREKINDINEKNHVPNPAHWRVSRFGARS
jgi:hypothetical protein